MSLVTTDPTQGATGMTEETDRSGAKIIPFPSLSAEQGITGASMALVKNYRASADREELAPVGRPSRSLLDEAFFRIAEALDPALDAVERSNLFDEWKDLLEPIARTSELSGNHRKILGSLLAVTERKDISDFSGETLAVLQDATAILRQRRVNRQDSKRVVSSLLKHGQEIMLPLATDDLNDDQIEQLDRMMVNLLEKSRAEK